MRNKLARPFALIRNNEPIFSYSLIPKPTPSDIISTHIHNTYEMLFFYDGDADYSVGGDIYHLKKYDLLLIKPSTYHNLILHSSHPYERTVCNFYEQNLPSHLVDTLRDLGSFFHIKENSPLYNIFESLKSSQDFLNEKDLEMFYFQMLPAIILHLKYLGNHAEKEALTIRSTIEKIIYYIDENPMKPLSLAALAKTFYLSESHISHLFKKHLNISATQYINRKKIVYAQSLIASGIPPAVVAEKCSYESYATFYRQYKKYLGVPPMHDFLK